MKNFSSLKSRTRIFLSCGSAHLDVVSEIINHRGEEKVTGKGGSTRSMEGRKKWA